MHRFYTQLYHIHLSILGEIPSETVGEGGGEWEDTGGRGWVPCCYGRVGADGDKSDESETGGTVDQGRISRIGVNTNRLWVRLGGTVSVGHQWTSSCDYGTGPLSSPQTNPTGWTIRPLRLEGKPARRIWADSSEFPLQTQVKTACPRTLTPPPRILLKPVIDRNPVWWIVGGEEDSAEQCGWGVIAMECLFQSSLPASTSSVSRREDVLPYSQW